MTLNGKFILEVIILNIWINNWEDFFQITSMFSKKNFRQREHLNLPHGCDRCGELENSQVLAMEMFPPGITSAPAVEVKKGVE